VINSVNCHKFLNVEEPNDHVCLEHDTNQCRLSGKMSVLTSDEIEEVISDILPGEVVHNENGDIGYRIINQVGAGRCCVVFKAVAIRDGTNVALKCFHRGDEYSGAVEREKLILEKYNGVTDNIVIFHDIIEYRDYTFFVLELLHDNVRQIIYKNDRQGLPPWMVIKLAKDIFSFLAHLHEDGYAHGDLKPHNILWSGQARLFKVIDFGLTYDVHEPELHQVESRGYRSPEAESWNIFKEKQKLKRLRKRKIGPSAEYYVRTETW